MNGFEEDFDFVYGINENGGGHVYVNYASSCAVFPIHLVYWFSFEVAEWFTDFKIEDFDKNDFKEAKQALESASLDALSYVDKASGYFEKNTMKFIANTVGNVAKFISLNSNVKELMKVINDDESDIIVDHFISSSVLASKDKSIVLLKYLYARERINPLISEGKIYIRIEDGYVKGSTIDSSYIKEIEEEIILLFGKEK